LELLDSNKKEGALSFYKEAQNIEFTQIIGKMDLNCRINSKLRDEILVKLGKRLFKNHPLNKSKDKIFSIRIVKRPIVLSQQEIDALLTAVDGNVSRISIIKNRILDKIGSILEKRISIRYKGKSYEIGFRKRRKIKPYTT